MARSLVVDLEHFDGRFGLLSGVWFDVGPQDDDYSGLWRRRDEAQFLFFMLDGVIYRVQEDPDDGYRSHLRDIVVTDQMPLNVWTPGELVIGNLALAQHDKFYRTDRGSTTRCQIVELVSVATGKCVLEFGTDDSEDYYPFFVASFHPENMGINESVANLLGEEKHRGPDFD